AQLLYGDGTLVVASTGAPITIVLTDGDPHIKDVSGTYSMTKEQFEQLKVLPPAESHVNFDVEMKVSSFEVDSTGVPVAGVAGGESARTVTIGVHAVTDLVQLNFVDGDINTRDVIINEEGTYDLSTVLKVGYPNNVGNLTADVDGSEVRW